MGTIALWVDFVGEFFEEYLESFRTGRTLEALCRPEFSKAVSEATKNIHLIFSGRKRVIYAIEPLYWVSTLTNVFAPSAGFLIISSVLGGFHMIAEYVCVSPLMVESLPIE